LPLFNCWRTMIEWIIWFNKPSPPTASTLKMNYFSAKITYYTHQEYEKYPSTLFVSNQQHV
jgi:hypothetical protein